MIKSLEIKNIQSHKDSKLNFHKGINCIVGSSNNGKSAILRALYWVRYNRPLGIDSLCSHWAINDKGNQTDEMSVIVDNGNIITRKRTKNDNQYIVNDKILNVVKSDIPTEVENAFRLSDTNIQRQLDEPFLLSSTSGEVAKYFNNIVRLDIIDKILTKAESTRRKNKQEIESLDKIIKNQELQLSNFDWLDKSEKLITKFENIRNKSNNINDQKCELESTIINYELLNKKINKYDFSKSEKLLEKIEKLKSIISDLSDEVESLENSINNFNSVKIYPSFENEKLLIDKIMDNNVLEIKNEVEQLQDSISDYVASGNIVEWKKKEIEELQNQLPETCPLCGGKL